MNGREPPPLLGYEECRSLRGPIDMFVSDSTNANPAAVALYFRQRVGTKSHWCCCWPHRVQLVMMHACACLLDGDEAVIETTPEAE